MYDTSYILYDVSDSFLGSAADASSSRLLGLPGRRRAARGRERAAGVLAAAEPGPRRGRPGGAGAAARAVHRAVHRGRTALDPAPRRVPPPRGPRLARHRVPRRPPPRRPRRGAPEGGLRDGLDARGRMAVDGPHLGAGALGRLPALPLASRGRGSANEGRVKNRIKVLRAERDWTQATLAERLGVARQTVHVIETGKFDPSL